MVSYWLNDNYGAMYNYRNMDFHMRIVPIGRAGGLGP